MILLFNFGVDFLRFQGIFGVFRRKVELFFKRNFRLMEWEQNLIYTLEIVATIERPSAQTPSLQVTAPMNFWTSLLELGAELEIE